MTGDLQARAGGARGSTNIIYLRVLSPVFDGLLKMFETTLHATQTSSFEDFISNHHVKLSIVAQGRDMSAPQMRYAIMLRRAAVPRSGIS